MLEMREKLKTVVVMSTMDAKGRELAYLAGRVREAGCRALLMDLSAYADSDVSADISVEQMAATAGGYCSDQSSAPRRCG